VHPDLYDVVMLTPGLLGGGPHSGLVPPVGQQVPRQCICQNG
jgi:hypothetical protein